MHNNCKNILNHLQQNKLLVHIKNIYLPKINRTLWTEINESASGINFGTITQTSN